jgi:hypothetical protein
VYQENQDCSALLQTGSFQATGLKQEIFLLLMDREPKGIFLQK